MPSLCLASLYEASPLAVVEAMAAAKPVVATRVGDLEQLVGSNNAVYWWTSRRRRRTGGRAQAGADDVE